jgi:putative ABC transport system permease protein
MVLNEGSWPADGKLGIERLSSQYFGADIGDTVTLSSGREKLNGKSDGLIRHPFVEPPLFGGQAHFFTDATGLAEFRYP